jgi:hypothetical protein
MVFEKQNLRAVTLVESVALPFATALRRSCRRVDSVRCHVTGSEVHTKASCFDTRFDATHTALLPITDSIRGSSAAGTVQHTGRTGNS